MSIEKPAHVQVIWEALHDYRENAIPAGKHREFDKAWDAICTAMAEIEEDLAGAEKLPSDDFKYVLAQRDELLEALKRIEGAMMSMYATRSDMLEDCQDLARAAIAKTEGGAV